MPWRPMHRDRPDRTPRGPSTGPAFRRERRGARARPVRYRWTWISWRRAPPAGPRGRRWGDRRRGMLAELSAVSDAQGSPRIQPRLPKNLPGRGSPWHPTGVGRWTLLIERVLPIAVLVMAAV